MSGGHGDTPADWPWTAVRLARSLLLGIQPDWTRVPIEADADALEGLAFMARRMRREGFGVDEERARAALTAHPPNS